MRLIYEYIDEVDPWKITIEGEESIDGYSKDEVTDIIKKYLSDAIDELSTKLEYVNACNDSEVYHNIIDEFKNNLK